MALTQAQIYTALQLMGLPARPETTFSFGGDSSRLRASELATLALKQVDVDQEAAVGSILTQFTAIQFDSDLLTASGLNSSSYRTRALLRKALADLIGYSLPLGAAPSIRRS